MPDFRLADLLQQASTRLLKALGDDGTRKNEASILLGSITGYDRTQMMVRGDEVANSDVVERFDALVERRISGEPVYRILGEREFHGLRFMLSPDTLEPRDDTEALIDLVLENVADRKASLRFADLGTGSGAVAVSLLSELPNARGIGSDVSSGALETAKGNAVLNGFGDRFETCIGSWCAPLQGQFDFIVSNPPYISSSVVDGLSREVLDHDPRLALDGGDDGLVAYREILNKAADYLTKDGFLALEIGFDQARSVRMVGEHFGWKHHQSKQDLGGRDRALLFFHQALSSRSSCW